jgi:hypothetical protein
VNAPLTDAEFAELLRSFETSAFRLELQPAYLEPSRRPRSRAYMRGSSRSPS